MPHHWTLYCHFTVILTWTAVVCLGPDGQNSSILPAETDGSVRSVSQSARSQSAPDQAPDRFTTAPDNQWSAITRYCNVHKEMAGIEGQFYPGFTLRQVHVVLAPGETTHVDYFLSGLVACEFQSATEDSEKIKTFQAFTDIYKKGQHRKSGFQQYHPVPVSYERAGNQLPSPGCPGNQLTSRGVKQHISTGHLLHDQYFHQGSEHKIGPQSNQIHAESVTQHSSYQSLLAFLHGFLPEKLFLTTAIHKTPGDFCSLLESGVSLCHCQKTLEDYDHVKASLLRGRFMFKDAFPDADQVRLKFGSSFDSHLSPVELLKVVSSSVCKEDGPVCDTKEKCFNITSKDARWLSDSVSKFFQELSVDPIFTSFSKLYTFPFLRRLTTRFSDIRNHWGLNAYSGDHVFLQALLRQLGVPMETILPQASRLVFDVYQKNINQINEGKVYIRILFNGQDVTADLQACKDWIESDLCPLEAFSAGYSQSGRDYHEDCMLP